MKHFLHPYSNSILESRSLVVLQLQLQPQPQPQPQPTSDHSLCNSFSKPTTSGDSSTLDSYASETPHISVRPGQLHSPLNKMSLSPPIAHANPISKDGIFVLNRTRILLILSLTITWSIAALLPSYKQTIKDVAKERYNNAVEHLPALKVDWHPNYDPKAQFNASKVAVLIEGRLIPHLVPQLLHMISVVPPDWRFMFIGTNKSVISVSRSFATQYHEANGKLDLLVLPEPWAVDSKEDVYRLLTDIRFYDEFMPEVEWMLKFESDSIMCANSDDSLNDWLHYDWAGAPRSVNDNFAGNGGLSLRRLSKVRKILSFQSRYNDTVPEDEWFGKRITVLPGAKVANGAEENHFSVEEVYHEKPMGYHVREGGTKLDGDFWESPEKRREIFNYCPELSMIMPMKLERERCVGDNKEGTIRAVK